MDTVSLITFNENENVNIDELTSSGEYWIHPSSTSGMREGSFPNDSMTGGHYVKCVESNGVFTQTCTSSYESSNSSMIFCTRTAENLERMASGGGNIWPLQGNGSGGATRTVDLYDRAITIINRTNEFAGVDIRINDLETQHSHGPYRISVSGRLGTSGGNTVRLRALGDSNSSANRITLVQSTTNSEGWFNIEANLSEVEINHILELDNDRINIGGTIGHNLTIGQISIYEISQSQQNDIFTRHSYVSQGWQGVVWSYWKKVALSGSFVPYRAIGWTENINIDELLSPGEYTFPTGDRVSSGRRGGKYPNGRTSHFTLKVETYGGTRHGPVISQKAIFNNGTGFQRSYDQYEGWDSWRANSTFSFIREDLISPNYVNFDNYTTPGVWTIGRMSYQNVVNHPDGTQGVSTRNGILEVYVFSDQGAPSGAAADVGMVQIWTVASTGTQKRRVHHTGRPGWTDWY